MSAITHLTTLEECNKLLTAKKDRLTVIDFHAAWCGPCHAIAPVFEKLANQYRGVTFCKVDVDKAQEIARAYRVSAMPTFVFVKGERKVHEVRGANAQALEAGIKQFSADEAGASGTFPGSGQTLSGTPVPTEVPPAEQNYLRYVLLVLAVGWWFYSSRQKSE
ncbi:mitochondrial thioredoxin [Rhodotorula kratochvilovae]